MSEFLLGSIAAAPFVLLIMWTSFHIGRFHVTDRAHAAFAVEQGLRALNFMAAEERFMMRAFGELPRETYSHPMAEELLRGPWVGGGSA